jgi:hypothetical protein
MKVKVNSFVNSAMRGATLHYDDGVMALSLVDCVKTTVTSGPGKVSREFVFDAGHLVCHLHEGCRMPRADHIGPVHRTFGAADYWQVPPLKDFCFGTMLMLLNKVNYWRNKTQAKTVQGPAAPSSPTHRAMMQGVGRECCRDNS